MFTSGDFVYDKEKNEYGMIVINPDTLNDYKIYRKVNKSTGAFYKACNIGNAKPVQITNNKLFGIYSKLYKEYLSSDLWFFEDEKKLETNDVNEFFNNIKLVTNNYMLFVYNKCLNTREKINNLSELIPGNVYLVASMENNTLSLNVLVYYGGVKLVHNSSYLHVPNEKLELLRKKMLQTKMMSEEFKVEMDNYLKSQPIYSEDIYGDLYGRLEFDTYCAMHMNLKNLLSSKELRFSLESPQSMQSVQGHKEIFELGSVNLPSSGEIEAQYIFMNMIDENGFRYVFDYFNCDSINTIKYTLVR